MKWQPKCQQLRIRFLATIFEFVKIIPNSHTHSFFTGGVMGKAWNYFSLIPWNVKNEILPQRLHDAALKIKTTYT